MPDALKPRGLQDPAGDPGPRGRGLRATEVPFEFGVRHSGDSKASAAEGARYLGQLWELRFET